MEYQTIWMDQSVFDLSPVQLDQGFYRINIRRIVRQ